MFHLSDQIEFRKDRRFYIFIIFGITLWTGLTFLVGMHFGSPQKCPLQNDLVSLGWLDKEASLLEKIKRQCQPTSLTQTNALAAVTTQNSPQTIHRISRKPSSTIEVSQKRTHMLKKRTDESKKTTQTPSKARRLSKKTTHLSKKRTVVAAHHLQKQKETSSHKKKKNSIVGTAFKAELVPPSRTRYTLSLELPRSRAYVMRIYRKLKLRGYHPLLSRKKKRFFMTLGRFPNKKAALRFAKKFQRQTRLSSTPLRWRR